MGLLDYVQQTDRNRVGEGREEGKRIGKEKEN